jgi:tetratricopeptide (TPR) repeat protein
VSRLIKNAAGRSRQASPTGSAPVVRGAAALVRSPAAQALSSAASDERMLRLLKEAEQDHNNGLFKASIEKCSEIIRLTGDRYRVAHFRRLASAVKANDFEYAAAHHLHARSLARDEDEQCLVDYTWVECLHAAGYYQDAFELADSWVRKSKKPRLGLETAAGLMLSEMGRILEAIERHENVLAKDPGYNLARWNLSINQLQAGRIPEAWANYEIRWQMKEFLSEKRQFDVPRWRGEPLAGKKLLIWPEQGIGDEIRFASMLPDLLGQGADVVVEVTHKIVPLLSRSFPEFTVRPELAPQCRVPASSEAIDYHIPIGSLAAILRPTLNDMILGRRPWVTRIAADEQRMRERLGVDGTTPVIGLCWRSGRQNLRRNQEYLSASELIPLRLLPKATFVVLQYDECSEEVALMRDAGLDVRHLPEIDQKNDLVAAAALAGACDLVLSAGTAVAELAAALGLPVLLFGRSVSQLKLGTEGVPWHPNTIYLDSSRHEPGAVPRQVLENWDAIARWAATAKNASTS